MSKSGVTIYHNPKCSKSRQALALIESAGVSPQVVLYLQQPPTAAEVKALLKKLGLNAADIIRHKEAQEEGVALTGAAEDALVSAIAAHPRILERPIVVKGDRAVVGRPPEKVLELL